MRQTTPIPAATPLDALQSSVRQRQLSPQGRELWNGLKRVGIAVVAMLLVAWLPGMWAQVLGSAAGLAAMVLLFRVLGREGGREQRIWTRVFAGCLLLLLVPWPVLTITGRVFLTIGATFYLHARGYVGLRELGSRRRAVLFLACFLTLVLMGLVPDRSGGEGNFRSVFVHLNGTAQYVVILFCLVTAVRLFIGIRLHFLRLRPKLAVAALLIAAVPFLLLLTLSVGAIYGLVGGNRATRGLDLMDDWLSLVAEDALIGPGPFGAGFGEALLGDGETGSPPAFLERLEDAVRNAPFDPMPEALWLRAEGELWALRVDRDGEGEGARSRLVGGRRVTRETVQRLADLLEAEVTLHGTTAAGVSAGDEGSDEGGGGAEVVDQHLRARPGSLPQEEDPDASVWEKWYPFGASKMNVYDLVDDGLAQGTLMLSLKTRPRDIFEQFVDDRNEINQIVAIAFAVLVGMFLLFELLALYFGLRIVGGITGAVHKLHGATERLARGDLDHSIDLPNEDEFGDLADSFNEMTRAIRLAQDQIVQKELLEQQLSMARTIQERLLPAEMPRIEGYQISGSSDPSLQVGGDYFDFVELGGGKWGIAVADVTGKGVPASLLMANVQAGLHGQAIHPGSAADMIGRMNELLYASTDPHMFVTFAFIVLDPATGRLESVSAGHEPTLLIRTNGEVEKLGAGGLMLGMLPGQTYAAVEAQLEPGDVLVMYTDGVTEAMGPPAEGPLAIEGSAPDSPAPSSGADADDEDDDEGPELPFFEEHRLIDVCVARRHGTAEEIRRALIAAVKHFAADVPQSDDITIVVVKREQAA